MSAASQLPQGSTEVKSRKGRKAYVKDDECLAIECTKCKQIKNVNRFSKYKKSFLGIKSTCKKCDSEYKKKNAERVREYNRKYNLENADRRKEKWKLHYRDNAAYYKKYRKKYKKENAERLREYNQKYREENVEYFREHHRKHRRENPEMYAVSKQRRRARESILPDDLSLQEYEYICKYFGNTCALSGSAEDIHVDHVIPIAIGHGGTIYGNIIPLSAKLNVSKSDSNIFEWFEANRQRFELSQDEFDRLIGFLAEANEMTVDEYRDYVYWCHENPRDVTAEDDDKEAI